MNCKEFEEIINDLAGDHLMLANKRVQALAHKEVCARCVARLRQERLLTEHLHLVADAEVVQTPVRVKASLMTAFALHKPISAAPVPVASVSVASENLPEPVNRWSRWAKVAAAAILILLAVVTLRLLNAGSLLETPTNAPMTTATEEKPKDAAPQKSNPKTKDTSPNHQPSIVARNPKPRSVESSNNNANQAAQNEVVTDYIALTYLNDSTSFDSGLVVRVQVSRSTLISMGLPMNAESSSELVKADVVMGDDGVARAIRFVHDSSPKADGKSVK